MKYMKRLILGMFLIALVTVVNFKKDDIYYYYQVNKFTNNYKENNNNYTNDYGFKFVSTNSRMQLDDITDIKNSIYTLLNSGEERIKRYCSKTYSNCIDDIKKIANDTDLLSYINSFVHPYNSFNNITFNFDGDIGLEIVNNKIYSEDDIKLIDENVDEILNSIIKDNTSVKEKIKIIHDYIINNTKYDTLRNINVNDKTYRSNTAYGVLFQGYGICSGYADTLAIFLNKLGIVNYKVSNDSHIWNLVLLDDGWYHVDLTWDDPVYTNIDVEKVEYNYFLLSTNELLEISDEEHDFDRSIYIEAKE